MKRVNKTSKNLEVVQGNLDKAYEFMERALEDLCSMTNLSVELKNDIERFDISRISCMKSDVEELIEQLNV